MLIVACSPFSDWENYCVGLYGVVSNWVLDLRLDIFQLVQRIGSTNFHVAFRLLVFQFVVQSQF